MISRLRRAVQSPTLKNTGWSALGSVVNGIIGAVSSAILARFLGVDDFGTFILILALLNFITDLSDLGLSSSVVKFGAPVVERGDLSSFANVVSAVLRMKLVFGVLVIGLGLLLLEPLIATLFQHVDGQVEQYFRLSLLAAVFAVPALIFPAILQTVKDFRKYSLVMMSRYLSKLLLLVAAVLFVTTWDIRLVLWIEIGSVAAFLLVGFFLSPLKPFGLRKVEPGLRRQILGFGKWISLYQIVALFGGKLDVFFVGGISDAQALGLYGAAMKIAGVVSVTTYSYFTALVPELSGMTSVGQISKHRKETMFVGMIMVGGIAVLAMIAEPVISLLFGERFVGAAPLLQVICIGLALNVIAHPFSATLFAQNRPQVFPISSGAAMFVFAVSNLVLIPVIGVMGAAVAFVLYSVALLAVVLLYYGKWKKNLSHEG